MKRSSLFPVSTAYPPSQYKTAISAAHGHNSGALLAPLSLMGGLCLLLPSQRPVSSLCTTQNAPLPSLFYRCRLPASLPVTTSGERSLSFPLVLRLGCRRSQWRSLSFRGARPRGLMASVGGGGGIAVSAPSEDLGTDGEVFRKTLRLVECAMFASVSALAYLLSNSLALENYLGCLFALPIVISSMRWGLAAGRKTMVATAVLLLTLAGPVKASTYLLMHGFLGFAMGSLWRLQISWGLSIALCSLVRALGAVGFVLVSSFLIRENILSLITINMHATLAYMCSSIGVVNVPTMGAIYAVFGVLLMINCGFLVLLLHILYAVFLAKLGMKDSLRLPRWMQKAM